MNEWSKSSVLGESYMRATSVMRDLASALQGREKKKKNVSAREQWRSNVGDIRLETLLVNVRCEAREEVVRSGCNSAS